MLSRFPFLPGGLAFLATACAMPQPGIRRTVPMDHTVLQGEQLRTERQIVEEREIQLLTVYGNLARLENRPMSVQLSSVLEAPIVEGVALRITRLVQQNQTLIVAYASPDGRALGALALVDISDPETPVLRAELQFPSMAVSSVASDGSFLYFAGLSAQSSRAALGRISIQNFEWQDDLRIQTLDMEAVSALTILGEKVWILDGSQGQLLGLNKKDWAITSQVSVSGLSQLGRDATTLWAHRENQILQWDNDLNMKSGFVARGSTGTGGHPGTIRIGQEMVMAGLGDEGVRAFCQANQKPLLHIPAVIRANLDPKRTNTREASLNKGLLMTANGDAGVYLYSVTTEDKGGPCKERSLQVEGYLNLGKDFRAEALNWQNDVLSVGDGQGRLNLFYVDRDTLETDDIDFDG